MNKKIHIAICGHNDEQAKNFNENINYKFYNLNNLSFNNSQFSNNTFGESRILLANNIFDFNKDILGTITASWSTKYLCGNFDSFFKDELIYRLDKIKSNEVFCTAVCYGKNHPNYVNNPIHLRNFQKNQRQTMPFTNDIQSILKYITGLEYDENSVVPYANQIITNSYIFEHYYHSMRKIILNLIEAFGIDFKFLPITMKNCSIIDIRRPFAYLVEESAMLWWSSQKGIIMTSLCDADSSWYSQNKHLC